MNSAHDNCKLVVFSNKAWNAIVSETLRKDPVETGGILLGHILSNGYWIVMEVIPPGLKAIHQMAYFEYDTEFVNYMANSVSKQYKMELDVLGLWHRHPGSMDVFSGTDDGTNTTFAKLNPFGAISGLVNIDPKFRFTLRHVAYPLDYQIVDVEVGDDLIPRQYFEMKYSFGEDLYPNGSLGDGVNGKTHIAEPERQQGGRQEENPTERPLSNPTSGTQELSNLINADDYISKSELRKLAKKLGAILVAIVLCVLIVLGINHFRGDKAGSGTEKNPPTQTDTHSTNQGKQARTQRQPASTTNTQQTSHTTHTQTGGR